MILRISEVLGGGGTQNMTFCKLDLFPPSGKGMKMPTLLDLLERTKDGQSPEPQ
jgi:hypothetical protein